MKYFLLISSAIILSLTSCQSNQNTEAKAPSSDSTKSTERRYIVPEGYTQGLPFTPGILVDGTLYIAGLSGEDAKTGVIPAEFETEVKQTLDKVGVVLKEAGMTYSDVVSVQVYITDMELFERMNTVYRSYFPEPRPTRTIVPVQKFPNGLHLEITVIARK
jgi:2-iminobutanoate/2-iminopropanoate deaminase